MSKSYPRLNAQTTTICVRSFWSILVSIMGGKHCTCWMTCICWSACDMFWHMALLSCLFWVKISSGDFLSAHNSPSYLWGKFSTTCHTCAKSHLLTFSASITASSKIFSCSNAFAIWSGSLLYTTGTFWKITCVQSSLTNLLLSSYFIYEDHLKVGFCMNGVKRVMFLGFLFC